MLHLPQELSICALPTPIARWATPLSLQHVNHALGSPSAEVSPVARSSREPSVQLSGTRASMHFPLRIHVGYAYRTQTAPCSRFTPPPLPLSFPPFFLPLPVAPPLIVPTLLPATLPPFIIPAPPPNYSPASCYHHLYFSLPPLHLHSNLRLNLFLSLSTLTFQLEGLIPNPPTQPPLPYGTHL